MHITVLPFDRIKPRISTQDFDLVITALDRIALSDPHYDLSKSKKAKIVQVWFSDTGFYYRAFGPIFHQHLMADKLYNGPDTYHIDRILTAAQPFLRTNARVGVACMAGVSRSPAIAYMLYCAETYSADQAFHRLMQDPRALLFQPNRIIVNIADELLGMNGTMVKRLNKFYVNQTEQEVNQWRSLHRKNPLAEQADIDTLIKNQRTEFNPS